MFIIHDNPSVLNTAVTGVLYYFYDWREVFFLIKKTDS